MRSWCARISAAAQARQFACFTGTKVPILTQKALLGVRAGAAWQGGGGARGG
jgi:hypothetical protein